MAQVKILIQGFVAAENNGQTCPTISLVRDEDIIMVVDPGILESPQMLVEALAKEGLKITDVTHIFITHSHLDHYRNIGMLPQAKTVEYFGIWNKGYVADLPDQLTDDIKIISTPGHSKDSLTLSVKTEAGIIAIVGDVFWQQNSPEVDPYATDAEQLKKSRLQVLALADYIVPGHGAMFAVKKAINQENKETMNQ